MPLLLLTLAEDQLAPELITAVHDHLPPHLTLLQTGDETTILNAADEIEVIAGWFKPEWLLKMPNLKWAQQWGAGANWLMEQQEVAERPFTLTNVSGVHAVPISEHIFAMLLAIGRNLLHAHEAQKAHVWAQLKHPTEEYQHLPFAFTWDSMFELADKTMLIIGVGAIGERTAKLAQAFDMRVIGVRHNPAKPSPYVDKMVGADQLLDVLPEADFVISTVPHTPDTYHQIGAKELAAMKSSAYLVNIGRGQTIDEAALLPALQNKTIAGAALDVFEQEPLPQDSPLWALDNLLITSHYSGGHARYHERAFAIFLDNLGRYQQGQPLRNVVNKELGY
jgi:phosphoglycerate dehydrogenase-like enzyme